MRLLAALFFTLLAVLARSQDNDLKVIGSAGASFHNDEIILDWTLGEVLITVLEHDSMMISQGFHQPEYRLVSSRPLLAHSTSFKVFPNPFSDQLTIQSSLFPGKKGMLRLADITGMVLWEKPIDGTRIHEYYFGESIAPGCYMLTIQFSGVPGIYTIPVLNIK